MDNLVISAVKSTAPFNFFPNVTFGVEENCQTHPPVARAIRRWKRLIPDSSDTSKSIGSLAASQLDKIRYDTGLKSRKPTHSAFTGRFAPFGAGRETYCFRPLSQHLRFTFFAFASA